MDNYRTLKRFNNSPEANIAKTFLIDNGILAVLNDEHTGEIFSTAIKGIKLDVPVDQYDEALHLLNDVPEANPVEDEEILNILEESGALLGGHFQLTSGLHSNRYIEKIKIIQQPDKVVMLCNLLAAKLKDIETDVVIGLAMGGIVLGYEAAKQMEKQFIFTQRKEGQMTVRSGFDLQPGMKAIIIEDIVTTGGSVKEVIELMDSLKVDVQAVGLLVDRTGGEVDFGVRTESLLKIKIDAYKPEECPLCKEGLLLTVPGSSDKK